MSYVNSHFKSKSIRRYKLPKSASEYVPLSNPSEENAMRMNLTSSRKHQQYLENKTMKQAPKNIVPQVFDLIANSVSIDSLCRSKFERVVSRKPIEARVIPRSPLVNIGTVNLSVKPVPVVENVGSMYHHPIDKVGVDLLKQKALRSVASLPALMERLLKIPRSSGNNGYQASPSPIPPSPSSPSIDKRARAGTGDSLDLIRQDSSKKMKADTGNEQGVKRGEIRRSKSLVDDDDGEDRKKKSRPDDAVLRVDADMIDNSVDDDKINTAKVLLAKMKSILNFIEPSSRSQIGVEISSSLTDYFPSMTERTSHSSAHRKISIAVSKLEAMLVENV
jgi:hypothetical protein